MKRHVLLRQLVLAYAVAILADLVRLPQRAVVRSMEFVTIAPEFANAVMDSPAPIALPPSAPSERPMEKSVPVTGSATKSTELARASKIPSRMECGTELPAQSATQIIPEARAMDAKQNAPGR